MTMSKDHIHYDQVHGDACMWCNETGTARGQAVVGVGEDGVDLWAHWGDCVRQFQGHVAENYGRR